jgi:arginyl-tRNA synthetase
LLNLSSSHSRSIVRNSGVGIEKLKEFANTQTIVIDHEKEWKLAKFILKYPEVILKVLNDFLIHSICDYIYELATIFTEFYDSCYCIEKDKQTGNHLNSSLTHAISKSIINTV